MQIHHKGTNHSIDPVDYLDGYEENLIINMVHNTIHARG